MTALGNVIALIRQLDDDRPEAPAKSPAPAGMQRCDFPPAIEHASSLGEVLAFIRSVVVPLEAGRSDEPRSVPSVPAPAAKVERCRGADVAIPLAPAASPRGAELRL